MTISIERMADELSVAPKELERRSLLAYIEREERLMNLDIADMQDRYRARSAQELALRIELGEVYAHPAWEELIEWEQLDAYALRLATWRSGLTHSDA